MKNPVLETEILELIESGKTDDLSLFCESDHPASIAETISMLSPHVGWQVLRTAALPLRSEIFSHVRYNIQAEIIEIPGREEISQLLTDMPPDDRAAFVKRLPEETRAKILPALSHAEREDIRRLSSYDEDTAGSVMTSDYVTLTPDLTAAQAIDRLREVAPDKETIYSSYVVDSHRRLLGFVSLKDLIIAGKNVKVEDIMQKDVIFAHVNDDQEEAARKIQKFDLIALPVINGGDALVGIITHDDALDIITQEYTEDVEKLMAISGDHETGVYLHTSSWGHFRNRAVWLSILAVLGLISGFIVQSFENLLLQFAIFAIFIPMLTGAGGNTGSQAATLVIRGLALGDVKPGDILKILFKELKVSLMLGVLLGLMAYGRVLIFGGGSTLPSGFSLALVGFSIAVALGFQVISSTLIGAMLPLAAARFKLDPAVVATPALTTIVDMTGLLIYFTTVKLILGI